MSKHTLPPALPPAGSDRAPGDPPGNSASREPAPRDPTPSPPLGPQGPCQAQQPLPCSGDLSSPGIQRNLTRPHSVLQGQHNPLPRDPRSPGKVAGKKKSLVYWAREASAGIRFPISAVSFQQIPEAEGERVAIRGSTGTGSRCGSGESEFVERSPDCGRN